MYTIGCLLPILYLTCVGCQEGPRLHKALGVAVIPTNPVYPKESEWSHMIKVEIPCLQDIITNDDMTKINDTLTVLFDLNNVTQHLTKEKTDVGQETRVNAMMMIYRSVRARIKNIYKEINTIKYKSQYLWGIFPRSVCKRKNDIPQSESPVEDYDTDETIRSRRALSDSEKSTINLFSFDKSSGTSFTLNQYFSNNSGNNHQDPTRHHLAQVQHDDPRKIYYNPERGSYQEHKYFPSVLPNHNLAVVQNPTKRPIETTTSTISKPMHQYNEIRDQFDDDDEGHFSSNIDLNDQPINQFNTWRASCVDPISRPNVGKHFLKICEMSRDKFGAYTDSCRSVYIDYLLFNPRVNRYRRAICNVCGEFYSWLYGTVSDKDMKDMISALKKDFTPIIETVNDGLSQQRLVAQVLNSSLSDITHQLNLIHNQTSSLKDFSNRMHKELNTLSTKQDITDRFDQFIGAVTILGSFLDSISTKIVSINTWLSSLKSSLQSQTIDLDLLPNFQLRKLFSSIKTSLPENMMISPAWNKLKFLKSNMASVVLSDHNIIIVVRVPLIMRSSRLEYWNIRAIPHLLSANNIPKLNNTMAIQTATVLNIPPGTAIIDQDNNRWAYLTETYVTRCYELAGSLCDVPTTWRTIDKNECIPSLIFDVNPQQAGAKCIVKLVSLHSRVEVVIIDRQHWLISILLPSIPVYQSCKKLSSKGSSVVEERTLTGLNLIEIPPNCQMQIDNYIMTGFRQLESEQQVHVDLAQDQGHNSTQSTDLGILIQQLNSSLAIPPLGAQDHFKQFYLEDSLFDFGTVSLEKLRTKLTNFKDIKMIDKSFYNLDQFEKQRSQNNGLFDFLPSWGLWPSAGGLLVLGCLIWWGKKYCVSSRHAMIGFGLQQLPQSAAVPVNITSSSININATDIMTLWIEHKDKISMIQLVVSIFMILLMVYCTVRLHQKLYPALGRMLSLNQIFPQAINVLHHPGEVPVTMTLLVSVKHLYHPETRAEIGIQVATLPLPADQWFADNAYPLSEALHQVTLSRWSSFHARFNWRHMCIKSILAEVETCEDMPSQISLEWEDVIYQLLHAMKWDWKSISLISITTLALGQGVNRRIIKSYLTY